MTTLCLADYTPDRRIWLATLWPSGCQYHLNARDETEARQKIRAVFGPRRRILRRFQNHQDGNPMTGFEAALFCLSLNVHFEASIEPPACQLTVAHSTINRAKRGRKPLCDVVFAPKQYSWTAENKPDPPPRAIARARRIAHQAITEPDPSRGATHYHRFDVRPYWASEMQYLGQCGRHLFYKPRPKP